MKKTLLAASVALLLTGNNAWANTETDELRRMIEQQQQMLEMLKQRLEETEKKLEKTARLEKRVNEAEKQAQKSAVLEQRLSETEQRLELAAEEIEKSQTATASPFMNTSIGGYGELHYNNIEDAEKIDFHRFVLFLNHTFSDTTRFFSELEVEHSLAGEGKEGEVEVEQAYIEHDLNQDFSIKAGLFLVPVGILNETHEPPTFYGVERNPIEKNIIPSTWWEAGAGFTWRPAPGWAVDTALHSGLSTPLDGSKAFLIRSGRQKVSNANADSLAFTGRLKFTGIEGLEWATTLQYQEDVAQGELDNAVEATLFETHIAYNTGPWGLRAMYARWDLDGSEPESFGRDEQSGFYIEPSYRFSDEFGIFARYNEWDNNAGDSNDTEKRQYNIGFNYWLHPRVVFKADWENRAGAQSGDGFNLGVGYQF